MRTLLRLGFVSVCLGTIAIAWWFTSSGPSGHAPGAAADGYMPGNRLGMPAPRKLGSDEPEETEPPLRPPERDTLRIAQQRADTSRTSPSATGARSPAGDQAAVRRALYRMTPPANAPAGDDAAQPLTLVAPTTAGAINAPAAAPLGDARSRDAMEDMRDALRDFQSRTASQRADEDKGLLYDRSELGPARSEEDGGLSAAAQGDTGEKSAPMTDGAAR
jgi:hypothetical protein